MNSLSPQIAQIRASKSTKGDEKILLDSGLLSAQ